MYETIEERKAWAKAQHKAEKILRNTRLATGKIPAELYHASPFMYLPWLDKSRRLEPSGDNCVYLSPSLESAIKFVLTKGCSGCAVVKVQSKDLSRNRLFVDRVGLNDGKISYAYKGEIPFGALYVYGDRDFRPRECALAIAARVWHRGNYDYSVESALLEVQREHMEYGNRQPHVVTYQDNQFPSSLLRELEANRRKAAGYWLGAALTIKQQTGNVHED